MRRIFSNPVTALAAGLFLRLFFVLKFPAGAGDSALYEQIAGNWLRQRVYGIHSAGAPIPVDVRMPGYPGFLAAIYALTHRTGTDARIFVMGAQVAIDLATCFVIAALAAVLVMLALEGARPRRAFKVALWLAMLCPFTANYTAVILTETLATFFTALALLFFFLRMLRLRASVVYVQGIALHLRASPGWFAVLAGLAVGMGTLVRPETPLLLFAAGMVTAWTLLRDRRWLETIRTGALMGIGCAIPLLPWAARNAVTLHEVQFLAPKNANLSGEMVPFGFMAWEKTWLLRMRDCYLVAWKLNDEEIQLDDVPNRAFDTTEEKQHVEDLLESYNQDMSLSPEDDAGFGQLARERTSRHPLRTYVWLPAARAVMIWVAPRIELLPFSGKVFPLRDGWEEDPVDQSATVFSVLLSIFYILLAGWGAWLLWRVPGARAAVALLAVFILIRTAFLAAQETPEPRYVLECFPGVLALGAQVFAGRKKIG